MNAKWIGYISDKKYLNIDKGELFGGVAQYFRKAFALKEKPVSATLKISALGIFKVFINGVAVSEEYFAPGWTNYNKRILYRVYDVTSLIDLKNAISVCVGDGWYAGYLSVRGRCLYGKYPLSIILELNLTYADGRCETISSDESWKGGEGAIRQNDFLCGEVYDDSFPHAEISKYEFNEDGFYPVFLTEDKSSLLTYCDYEPCVLHESFTAKKLSEDCGKAIYDFGQNFAGVVTVKAVGEKGAKIIIRHAEILKENGELYVKNLRTAKATDTLILNGREITYTPTFTYHGFRYVEISVVGNAKVLEITGRALYNDLNITGIVSTDNQLVNKLISNVTWGMKSNFVDIPTDCPQRNERLGWTADTQVFSRTATYFADCRKFYSKYLLSVVDESENGVVPDVVPGVGVARRDSSFWRDVAVVLPYNLHEIYGDKVDLTEFIPLIIDFLNLQMKTAKDYVWKESFYNDWLNIDENSPETTLATCVNAYCLKLGIKILSDYGKDVSVYSDFLRKVKEKFSEKFISDGQITDGTQTVYAISYRANLISEDMAKTGLERCFKRRNDHIHSGFCGIRFILPALCDVGLCDLAYDLITKTTFPSWGYSIENGATTLWERWDSYVKGKGVASENMNSFNHYSFGSCGEWFFEYMLGIKPNDGGFKSVIISPCVCRNGKVNGAKGSFDSVNGKISVEWSKNQLGYVCVIEKPQMMLAEYRFKDITAIVQDGIKVNSFSPYAKRTEVYFK